MSSDSSVSSSHRGHDSEEGGSYKKRCYCEKCVKKYDEWCSKKKREGDKVCKRKCYTVCQVKCAKPTKIVKKWGYKKKYEGKWEKHDAKEPKYCNKHKKAGCGCGNEHSERSG